MHRWGPRLDWEHLQNWVPGVLGAFAVILLVVIAANSPTQTNSKPSEVAQSATVAAKGHTGAPLPPSQPAAPKTSSGTDKVAKAPTPPAPFSYLNPGIGREKPLTTNRLLKKL